MVKIFEFKKTLKVKQVCVGALHCLAIIDGEKSGVYSWGKNSHGQLGIGFQIDYVFEPTKIKFSSDIWCK